MTLDIEDVDAPSDAAARAAGPRAAPPERVEPLALAPLHAKPHTQSNAQTHAQAPTSAPTSEPIATTARAKPDDAHVLALTPAHAHARVEAQQQAPVKPTRAPRSADAVAVPYRENLRFDGKGSEYFRVWVVNLFFTLITLGVYSAWAKVRKARWFAQHTSLAGDRFDYHGEPWRVLSGRLIAIVLLALWTFAFDLSAVAGLVVLAVFCGVGPMLFSSAQRFRMANTSWRGLRFGYDVPRSEVYIVCVPLLLLWAAGSVLDSLGVNWAWYVFAGLATAVGLPWAHARLKQLQHHHAHYGEQQFSFRPAGNEFYVLYLKALLLVAIGVVCAVPLMTVLSRHADDQPSAVYGMLAAAAVSLFMWLAAWPYFAARMQQIVWSHTELGHGVRFDGQMKGAKLWALVLGQTLLTLLTFGLYWPFAAVAIARYRVESIVIEADVPIGDVAGTMSVERRATGDAALDFFGLDLGW